MHNWITTCLHNRTGKENITPSFISLASNKKRSVQQSTTWYYQIRNEMGKVCLQRVVWVLFFICFYLLLKYHYDGVLFDKNQIVRKRTGIISN